MENEKPILRGELALIAAIVINSFSVVLMLIQDQEFPRFQVCRMHFRKYLQNYHSVHGLTYFRELWY